MTIQTKRIIVALLLIACGAVLIIRAASHDDPVMEADTPYAEKTEAVFTYETSAGAEKMIDRRFDVSDGGTLEFRVSHTEVVIETGDVDEARVEVFLDARDMDRARDYFASLNFTVEQNGNTILVETQRTHGNWSWNETGQAQITVRAFIPTRFNADVTTSHGDVAIGTLRGRFDLKTSHGDVEVESLGGPSLSIKASHGDVVVGAMESEDIRIETSHGDVDLDAAVARNLTIRTSHGDIDVEGVRGRADLSNSHGDIEVQFEEMGNSYLRTSHGDIMITTPSRLEATLDLKADRVRVSERYRFEGEVKKDRADGRINGGGPRLEARTSHGHITMKAN